MIEQGIVEKIDVNIAIVKIYKNASCDSCNLCDSGDLPDERILKVKNILSSKVGDRVQIQIPSATIIQSAFMIFILPVLALILGYFMGQGLTDGLEIHSELLKICAALLLAGLSFWAIRIYDRKMSLDDSKLPLMKKVLYSKQK